MWILADIDTYAYSEDAESPQPGFPLRHWGIQITLIHQETKQEVPAECLSKVMYKLHPSFGVKEKQGLLISALCGLMKDVQSLQTVLLEEATD